MASLALGSHPLCITHWSLSCIRCFGSKIGQQAFYISCTTENRPQSRILVVFSAITNNPSCSSPSLQNLVYVIGLHAVQFGNNWLRQIPRTAKLDENFSNSINQFQFGQHVVLLRVNYIVHEVCSLLTVNLDSMKNQEVILWLLVWANNIIRSIT